MSEAITELAFRIADNAARCDIETLCSPVGGEPRTVEEIRSCWFDLDQVKDPDDSFMVSVSVEYLERRGLLKRHPTQVNWVRPRHTQSMALGEEPAPCFPCVHVAEGPGPHRPRPSQ